MSKTDHTAETFMLNILCEDHSSTWPQQIHPVRDDVPLAGGVTAFFRPGGGTFFSGSGFLGTTGTLKILFYFVISVSQTQRQQTQQQHKLC